MTTFWSKMSEAFLHFIWKYSLFNNVNLKTNCGKRIEIISKGIHNSNAGPDFIESKIRIDEQIWFGQVEIHINSSDWFKHNHHSDPSYNQVILHVVYKHDKDIVTENGISIPTLVLGDLINPMTESRFLEISGNRSSIPCSVNSELFSDFDWKNLLDRLLVERLERKSESIFRIYESQIHSWEDTFYILLARNFGFKINADAFEFLAKSLPLKILLRHRDSRFQLEALLFGQAGLLNDDHRDNYPGLLRNEYEHLKNKYSLVPLQAGVWKYLRMMPGNFPTVRISQFAHFFFLNSKTIFSSLLAMNSTEEIFSFFDLEASEYWKNHSQFDRESKFRNKRLGHTSKVNIIINSIAPLVFFYGRNLKNQKFVDQSLNWYYELNAEKNNITKRWLKKGFSLESAAHSQASIELFNEYCSNKKCLNCRIGLNLIK